MKSKKAVTNSDRNVLIVRSPFKNRPRWSKAHSPTPNPPNFSGASVDQSKQANGSLSHPRWTPEDQSAKTPLLLERYGDARPITASKQEKHISKPSHTPAVAPNEIASHDGPRTPRHVSLGPEGFLPLGSISTSIPPSFRAPGSTPLAERPRGRVNPGLTWPSNTKPPIGIPSSQVSVVIDNSQRSFAQSTATEELLNRFIQPSSASSARYSERATTGNKPIQKEYRRQLLAELENDTSVIFSRASSVEAVFGPHGFSTMYGTDGENALRKQLAQPKAKRIRRKQVKLDWASSDTFVKRPFEPQTLILPQEQANQILRSRFDDAIDPPITFVNDLNDKQLSGRFQFISSYIRRPGVEAAPQETRIYGCDCIGKCRPDSCGCLVEEKEIDDFGDETNHGKIVPYQRVQTAVGETMSVLRDDYMKKSYADGEKSEIIECNRDCGCASACWDRVVQKGSTIPLEIFMTAKCGFGEFRELPFAMFLLTQERATLVSGHYQRPIH